MTRHPPNTFCIQRPMVPWLIRFAVFSLLFLAALIFAFTLGPETWMRQVAYSSAALLLTPLGLTLLTCPRFSQIWLSDQGVEAKALFKDGISFAWSELAELQVVEWSGLKVVALNLAPEYSRHKDVRERNRKRVGWDWYIVPTGSGKSGMTADALKSLLEEWRARYKTP